MSPDFSGLAQSDLGLAVNAATVTNVTASPTANGQEVALTLTLSEAATVNLTGGIAEALPQRRLNRDLQQQGLESVGRKVGVRLHGRRR